MKNKSLYLAIFSLVILAGAVVFYLHKAKNKNQASNQDPSVVPQVVKTEDAPDSFFPDSAGEFDSSSTLASLNDSTAAVAVILPKHLDPAVVQVRGVYESLKNSAIWKKLGLDQQMNSSVGMAQQGDVYGDQFEQFWSNTEEITFALSNTTYTLAEGLVFPHALVKLRSKTAEFNTQIKTLLQAQLLASGQNKLVFSDGSTLESLDAEGNNYKFSLSTGPESPSFPGKVAFSGNDVDVVIGEGDHTLFLVNEDSPALTKSAAWSSVSKSITPTSGTFTYADMEKVTKYVEGYITFMALELSKDPLNASQIPNASEITASWEGLKRTAFSLDVSDTLSSYSCAEFDSDSQYASLLKSVEKRDFPALREKSTFYKLTSSNTLFATRLLVDVLPYYIDTFESNYGKALSDQPGLQAESEQFKEIITRLRAVYEKFGFVEFGVLLNAPEVGAIPEFGFYLGGSKLAGEELLKEFTSSVNEYFGASQKIGPITLKQDPSGESYLEVATGMTPMPGYGTTVDGNSILVGNTKGFVDGAISSIPANGKFLSSIASKTSFKSEALTTADSFFYFNTELAFKMLKPWYFFLVGQIPNGQVQDIEEVAKLFETKLFGAQISQKLSDEVVCGIGFMDSFPTAKKQVASN